MICLLALIAVHALSFNNRAKGDGLFSSVSGAQIFLFLGAMNSLFVFLAGVTLRIQLQPAIRNSRLTRGTFRPVAETLFVLLCIDLLKNHLLYRSPSIILEWDFLRTLSLSWILIYILSRIHIGLNLLVAGAVSWWNPQLRQWLLQFEWSKDQGWPPLNLWNAYHSISIAAVLALAIGLIGIVWTKTWPRAARLLVTTLIFLFAASLVRKVAQFEPRLWDYQDARNWWIYGLVGDRLHSTLMPLFAWGPSAWIGFAGTHYVLREKHLLQHLSPGKLLVFSVPVASVLIYMLLFRYEILVYASGNSSWNSIGNSETTFAGETMKVAYFLMIYGAVWWMTLRRPANAWDVFAEKFSQATFWIYIVATASTQVLASSLFEFSSNFWMNFAINFGLSAGLCALVAEGTSFFAKRRIAFYLRKAPT